MKKRLPLLCLSALLLLTGCLKEDKTQFYTDVYWFKTARETIEVNTGQSLPVDTSAVIYRLYAIQFDTDSVGYEVMPQSSAVQGEQFEMLSPTGKFPGSGLTGKIPFRVFPWTVTDTVSIILKLTYSHPANNPLLRRHDQVAITLKPFVISDIYSFESSAKTIALEEPSPTPVDTSVVITRLKGYPYTENEVGYEVDTKESTAEEGVNFEMLSTVGTFTKPDTLRGSIPMRIFPQTLEKPVTIVLKLKYEHPDNNEISRKHNVMTITLNPLWVETPDTPDTPDNPENPENPENPDTPDNPQEPGGGSSGGTE